jgi:hypothetical protein
MTRWQLENTKTGAHIIFASEAMARRAAVNMGWVDYVIERVK